MTHPQVICMGEILFDRLSNELGKPLETVKYWTDYPGGAPANTACGLVKLGIPDEEAELLFNTIDPEAIAKQLQIQGVFVTAGERGCAYYLAGNYGKIPAFSVTVEDTTGAGDGFTAGIIDQFCKLGIESINHPKIAEKIVRFASAVGALTTTKPGAISAQPTLTEVETFLNHFL